MVIFPTVVFSETVQHVERASSVTDQLLSDKDRLLGYYDLIEALSLRSSRFSCSPVVRPLPSSLLSHHNHHASCNQACNDDPLVDRQPPGNPPRPRPNLNHFRNRKQHKQHPGYQSRRSIPPRIRPAHRDRDAPTKDPQARFKNVKPREPIHPLPVC